MNIISAISMLTNSLIDTRKQLEKNRIDALSPVVKDTATGELYRITVTDGKINLVKVDNNGANN